MTQNQIQYWSLLETQRANRAKEGETATHNRATESIESGKLRETGRHNVASERVEQGKLSESGRHNRAQEALTKYSADSAAGASRYASDKRALSDNAATQQRESASIRSDKGLRDTTKAKLGGDMVKTGVEGLSSFLQGGSHIVEKIAPFILGG